MKLPSLTWLQRRRFKTALRTINEQGELTFSQISCIVGNPVKNALAFELAHSIGEGKITVRYDAVQEGIFVESQTSILDFSNSIDVFNDVEAVYMKKV